MKVYLAKAEALLSFLPTSDLPSKRKLIGDIGQCLNRLTIFLVRSEPCLSGSCQGSVI